MYFLQCIDYLFQTKLHKSSLVNTIQNAHVIFVSMSCGLGLLSVSFPLFSTPEFICF